MNRTTNNNQKRPASTRRYGLVFFGGFLLGILLAVAVTGPIIAVLNSKLDGTTTVDITISTTTTTSTASKVFFKNRLVYICKCFSYNGSSTMEFNRNNCSRNIINN